MQSVQQNANMVEVLERLQSHEDDDYSIDTLENNLGKQYMSPMTHAQKILSAFKLSQQPPNSKSKKHNFLQHSFIETDRHHHSSLLDPPAQGNKSTTNSKKGTHSKQQQPLTNYQRHNNNIAGANNISIGFNNSSNNTLIVNH